MRRVSVPRWLMALGTFALVASIGAAAVALRRKPPIDWRAALATSLAPRAGDRPPRSAARRGGRVELTLEPELQRAAERLLGEANPIQGAAVSSPSRTAACSRSPAATAPRPSVNDVRLATSAWAPAASVFKLVTTAALLGAGVTPATRVCYHAGAHSVEPTTSKIIPSSTRAASRSATASPSHRTRSWRASRTTSRSGEARAHRARARLGRAARVRSADDGVDAGAAVRSARVRARRRRLLEHEPLAACTARSSRRRSRAAARCRP